MNLTHTRREPIAASAAGVGSVSFLGETAGAAPAGEMASPGVPIATVLRIDGREYRVSHDIRASLLDTLRAQFGLCGAQPGCGHGRCGACTLHVDGQPKLACLTLTVAAQGADITTGEGLAGHAVPARANGC